MTARQDNNDVGYCLQVTPAGVNVAKIFLSDPRINSPSAFHLFIKCLVDASAGETLSGFMLDAACCQFSDPRVTIYCDDCSILKGLPFVARTGSGIPLHGNLCIVGSDADGDSILLTEKQIVTVLQELNFPEQPFVNQIDLTDPDSILNDEQEEVGTLRKLLELLVNHCVNNEVQLVTRAKAISKDTDDSVLIVCLHGNDDAIKQLHAKVQRLISKSEIG